MASQTQRHPRYETRRPTYAYLGPDSRSVAKVRNLSRGGMGLDYVEWQGDPTLKEATEHSGFMDLVVNGERGGIRISDIPYEVVYTKQAAEAYFYWAANYRVISCGLKFGNLTLAQQRAIDDLLTRMAKDSSAQ